MDEVCPFKSPCQQESKKSGSRNENHASLVIPASPFMKKLGYGTGVNVYLMKRSPTGKSNSPWAVKKINSMCNVKQKSVYLKRLQEEAKRLKDIEHPNIVGYRAFTKANDGTPCLAMEFGGEKSLNDLIEERSENSKGPFPASTILKVALHVAYGLKYLHNEQRLLHGDIKSCNIVIKKDFETIKICDVGVSLKLDENMQVSDPKVTYIGTEPWKPKEALEENGLITDKSDIFAYGLTLWEMMTLSMPHVNISEDSSDEDCLDEDAYYTALGTRPALNVEELDDSYREAIELFLVCTNENPKKRPSAAQIVEELETATKRKSSL
ncbi:lymphokine-activated killer T-cell-originated protein kinase homolog isoform X1 [Heterodontus francisci]|uniref:lymphokine-activated killer T-cell-originated protein kinase homolog isoform X1 n=1 Tax=Heterodontus francisci TaxID=7792 RepID=UPI00355C5DD9